MATTTAAAPTSHADALKVPGALPKTPIFEAKKPCSLAFADEARERVFSPAPIEHEVGTDPSFTPGDVGFTPGIAVGRSPLMQRYGYPMTGAPARRHRGSEGGVMENDDLVLVAGTYPDAGDAAADFKALKSAQDAGDYAVVGAVVVSRDEQGKVKVDEHGGGEVGGGAVLGGAGGLVVGLFAPPLLLATAIGAGIGAGIGALVKRHEEKEMGADLDEYLPLGSSAVIAVVDDTYADNVEKALGKADKTINKAIDSGDVDKLKKALADAGHDVDDAIES